MDAFPMFPLGSVLFPGALLPLQIFEPRYQEMLADLSSTDDRFGVVLIRRGHEVGGGEDRYDVGTIAQVIARQDLGEGVSMLSAIGRERFRVRQWLDDDPYPRANIELIELVSPSPGIEEAVSRAAQLRQQLLALAIEMGADGQVLELELPADPIQAAWVLCSHSPAGPFDRQKLLEIDDPTQRLNLLGEILLAHLEDLRRVIQQ